jgi:hypothetical protein
MAIPPGLIPCSCVDLDAFGVVDLLGDIVQLLPLPDDHPWQACRGNGTEGINDEKTALYCIPASATSVLKVDISTRQLLIPVDVDETKYRTLRWI